MKKSFFWVCLTVLALLACIPGPAACAAPVLADGDYTAYLGEKNHLFIQHNATGNLKTLRTSMKDILSISDGNVYCLGANGVIYEIRLDGTSSSVAAARATQEDIARYTQAAPYTLQSGVLNLQTDETERLVSPGLVTAAAADGEWLYYAELSDKGAMLRRLSLTEGAPADIGPAYVTPSALYISGDTLVALDPDGDAVIYNLSSHLAAALELGDAQAQLLGISGDTLLLYALDVETGYPVYTGQMALTLPASPSLPTAPTPDITQRPDVTDIAPTLELTPPPTATPGAVLDSTPAPSVTRTLEPNTTATPAPTLSPTPDPTATPTAEPTLEPTATPTPEPTATPTLEPTATPTPEPTATPTLEPTATPMLEPTATPTPEPTATPTFEPTAAPVEVLITHMPTVRLQFPSAPTVVSVEAEHAAAPELPALEDFTPPIITNIVSVSIEPTASPEPASAPEPTATPTPEPTASPEPTATPTPEPTASPEPTATPTPEPTATPEPAATPTPEPTATLAADAPNALSEDIPVKYGQAGIRVFYMQNRLNTLGYPVGDITSVFSDQTLSALNLFQEQAHFPESPAAAPDVLSALYSDSAPVFDALLDRQAGQFGERVRLMQKRLWVLGYDETGDIDGMYGLSTFSAVRRFQTLAGLPATGMADRETMRVLYSDNAPVNE